MLFLRGQLFHRANRVWHPMGFALLAAACLSLTQASALANTSISLQSSTQQSTDGVVRLSWEVSEATRVHIQQSNDADFRQPRTLYRGKDTATTITGLPDGDYFFRISDASEGASTANWSEPVRLQVRHHSLSRAFGFFTIGVVVFLGTLALVVNGSRRQSGDDG
jgi:hypothetical protein